MRILLPITEVDSGPSWASDVDQWKERLVKAMENAGKALITKSVPITAEVDAPRADLGDHRCQVVSLTSWSE